MLWLYVVGTIGVRLLTRMNIWFASTILCGNLERCSSQTGPHLVVVCLDSHIHCERILRTYPSLHLLGLGLLVRVGTNLILSLSCWRNCHTLEEFLRLIEVALRRERLRKLVCVSVCLDHGSDRHRVLVNGFDRYFGIRAVFILILSFILFKVSTACFLT